MAMATGKDASFAGPLGGVSKVTPGTTNGYTAYSAMMALKLAMRAANFTGKADTEKLITALRALNVKQGADFPAGDVIMNKADHQGRQTAYILKINGQKEDVLETIPADKLPLIGDCQAK
jgi:ABC-type branched-subunit amino acid transport system substrate-binding protein